MCRCARAWILSRCYVFLSGFLLAAFEFLGNKEESNI
jgi:hypothetical protein